MGFRKMIKGFRGFHHDYFKKDRKLYERLVNDGQSPKVMMIACSDSRIDPALITRSSPGDIFSVRNIAALVNQDDEHDHRGHGTTAAVEYAVKVLKVEHIVVMGHALCGGCRALASSGPELATDNSFIAKWIAIGSDARDKVRATFPKKSLDDQSAILEKTSILVSVNNLMSYSWVREAVEAGRLKLHGWYFDMAHGALLNYNPMTNVFENILDNSVSAAMCHASIDRDAAISITGYLKQMKELEDAAKKRRPGVVSSGAQSDIPALRKTGAKIKHAAQSACLALTSPALLDSEICALAMEIL